MCAELTILTINAKEVTKGFSPICIEDIGVGGVRFKSKLNIPMNDTVTFGIKFSIYDTEYLLPASIVWKNELKTGYIEYGCKFEMKDTEREQYIPIFNRFSVEVAKNIKNIKKYLSTPRYINAYQKLDMHYLPAHWRLFFTLCKRKMAVSVYILLIAMKKIIEK